MKVYLTYEINGGELIIDCGAMGDIDCYRDLDEAVENTVDRISDGLEYGFVADYEPEKVCKICEKEALDHTVLFKAVKEAFEENKRFELVMFRDKQENWNEHYSIIIEEKELQ